MSALTIDGYRFTETDARKTVMHAAAMLDMYPAAVHPNLVPRRERITNAVAAADLSDIDELWSALRRVWPELLDARHDFVASGHAPRRSAGTAVRISASDGGVPKGAVDCAEVGRGGVDGDRQAHRQHHGRPWQALCLWSSEVIAALAADGHPIGPGCAGENVTVSGLTWSEVTPGVQLLLGSVRCQVSAYAVPCQQNAGWFSDRDFSRIHHSRGPISRVYATVLEPGTIATGDAVVLEV